MVLLRGFVVVDQQGVQVGVEMLVVALQAFNNLQKGIKQQIPTMATIICMQSTILEAQDF